MGVVKERTPVAHHGAIARLTLHETLRRFKGDLARRLELNDQSPTAWNVTRSLTKPGVVGVLLFRINDWFYERRWRIAVRIFERFIFLVTRSELQAGAKIGVGFVLPDEGTVGITAAARIGSNCTFHAMSTVIMWSANEEGAGVAEVNLGDYCVIGRKARVFGAIFLGDGTQVKPNSLVMASFVRPGMILSGVPARRRGQVSVDAVRNWNPLKGRPLAMRRDGDLQ